MGGFRTTRFRLSVDYNRIRYTNFLECFISVLTFNSSMYFCLEKNKLDIFCTRYRFSNYFEQQNQRSNGRIFRSSCSPLETSPGTTYCCQGQKYKEQPSYKTDKIGNWADIGIENDFIKCTFNFFRPCLFDTNLLLQIKFTKFLHSIARWFILKKMFSACFLQITISCHAAPSIDSIH